MPSISIIQNPGTYSPTIGNYSKVWSILNSTSSTQSNWKYIYNLKVVNQTTNATSSIGEFISPPQPVTGYGRVSFNEILNTQMTYNIQPFIATGSKAEESIVKYFFNTGFQYDINADFVDITNYFGPNAFIAINTFTPYDIQSGDILTIELNNQSVNPQYNGNATVLSVTNIFGWQYIEINKLFVAASIAEVGTIKTVTIPASGTSSIYYAYNGSRQYNEVNNNFSNTHVFYNNNNMVRALTNYKTGLTSSTPVVGTGSISNTKKIKRNQYETLSLMFDNPTYFNIIYDTYDVNKTKLNTYTYSASSICQGDYRRYDIPVGTTGSNYITNWNNAKYYSVRVDRVIGDEPPFTYRNKMIKYYEIDDSCDKGWENYRIAFKNRHGGFDYWNFNLKSTNNLNVETTEYSRNLDWDYSIGDREDTTLSVKANESYTVNTDFIDKYDYLFLKELITTREAYLIDEVNMLYYPIIGTTKELVVDNDIENTWYSLSYTFRMAYDLST